MAEDDDKRGEEDHDVVLVHGRTEDGEGVRALRSRPKRLDLAEIRPVKRGKPLQGGELVRLRQRGESPLLYDVDVQYADESDAHGDHAGPPRVTSSAYRRNWEAIFGKTSAASSRSAAQRRQDRKSRKPLPN
jgi:hypothetical protein